MKKVVREDLPRIKIKSRRIVEHREEWKKLFEVSKTHKVVELSMNE